MSTIGVILAGGKGTRLFPLTNTINKHLLNVFNKPMFYYPLSTLLISGIKNILIICNPSDLNNFKKYFGNGNKIGCNIQYAVQKKSDGIVSGLKIANNFNKNKNIFLILGDQFIYSYSLQSRLMKILDGNVSTIFSTIKSNPQDYGVLKRSKNKIKIFEKPKKYISNEVIIGLYYYDQLSLSLLKNVKKSKRGEYEITSFNNILLNRRLCNIETLGRGDSWLDIGDPIRLNLASNLVKSIEESKGLMVGCPEEIAFRKKYIDRTKLGKMIKNYSPSLYKEYLKSL